jgi:branched-chain amino acid transport system permease protein
MQILVNGFIEGLLIAMMAMGFCLVYNSTGVLHIAQVAVYAIAPFILMSLLNAGCNIPMAVTIAIAVSIVLSLLIEKFNHWPLYEKGTSTQGHFISSLGIYIIVVQIIAILWGNDTKVLQKEIDAVYNIFNVVLTRSQLLGAVVSIVAIGCFFLWLKKSDSGIKFMALADNPIQLSLMGYDISKMRLLAFAMSGIFTALASLLKALDVGFDPYSGFKIVLLAVIATIIGGKGSFAGPVIGGIALGIIRSQVVWYTSAKWEDAVSFLILVLFLFFRPQGLLGEKGRIEAQ